MHYVRHYVELTCSAASALSRGKPISMSCRVWAVEVVVRYMVRYMVHYMVHYIVHP